MIRKPWPFLSSYQERTATGDSTVPAVSVQANITADASPRSAVRPRIRAAHLVMVNTQASLGASGQASHCPG